MKTFSTARGEIFVDDANYDFLNQYSWCVSVGGYAVARDRVSGKVVYMHRLLMGNPKEHVDHRNTENKLDNRMTNLRIATPAQNAKNQKIRSNNTSGFKGVSWDSRKGRWAAYIKTDYRRKFLGYFGDKLDAAQAYDRAALELHGEFARLNNA